MAFVLDNFAPMSSHAANSPRAFSYSSADDAVATIGGADYFADVSDILRAGDQLTTYDSAGVMTIHKVTAVSPTVTISLGTTVA